MDQFQLIGIFLFILFLLLGTGVWVGLALLGVAFAGMEFPLFGLVGVIVLATVVIPNWRSRWD